MQPFLTTRDRPYPTGIHPSGIVNAVITPADEPLSIDELITATIDECKKLPSSFSPFTRQIGELRLRLAHGRLHLAVIGEFNRGKSTFINGLIGMHLLPTSVLPITAVPTRIIYGPELSCKINFFNGKPQLLVRTSAEMIQQALLKYVAEENNPKNKYGVDIVEVTVPSPLLENGTVLIDTPGFGSTHLHNTKTALDALADCDAALFLLSADPPMTQTEVEFLKQVIRQVPRLFFILNKVDLLTPPQRNQVDRFIGGILMAHLHQTEKPHLFHICARRAENAHHQSTDDPHWASSGMEEVRKDVITFMAREKYFTLSQALNDKLKESINSIISLLQKEKGTFDAPVELLNKERHELQNERATVCKVMEKEIGLIAAEKKAVLKFFEEQLSVGKTALQRQIREAVTSLIDTSACDASAMRSISTALDRIITETFATFRTRLFARLNRPVKKTLMLHAREFETVLQSTHDCVSGIGELPENSFTEKLEALELDPDETAPLQMRESSDIALNFTLQWSDTFYGRQARIKRLHERYDHRIDEQVQNNFFLFSKELRQRIDALFTALEGLLATEYRQLTDHLDTILTRKETSISGSIELNNRSATVLSSTIESFRRIAAQLR